MSGEVAFGAAISEDRKHGSIVAAGRGTSGKILVDLAPFYDHPRLLVARMAVLYAKHDPVAVVVNPKAQSVTLLKPLRNVGIVALEPSVEDVATAHGDFLDLVNDGGLEHLDQKPLTDAVRAAQQRPLAGASAWDPKVAVDQSPLMAATGAVWAFLRWEGLATPGVWQVLGGPEDPRAVVPDAAGPSVLLDVELGSCHVRLGIEQAHAHRDRHKPRVAVLVNVHPAPVEVAADHLDLYRRVLVQVLDAGHATQFRRRRCACPWSCAGRNWPRRGSGRSSRRGQSSVTQCWPSSVSGVSVSSVMPSTGQLA